MKKERLCRCYRAGVTFLILVGMSCEACEGHVNHALLQSSPAYHLSVDRTFKIAIFFYEVVVFHRVTGMRLFTYLFSAVAKHIVRGAYAPVGPLLVQDLEDVCSTAG